MAQHPFLAWGNFYLIVGAAGATLIGVQFVVMTLVTAARKRPSAITLGAFATPTVVHFVAALLVSAIMTVPWPSLALASAALALAGLGGVGYGTVVIRRALRQTSYQPTLDDWLWYGIVPALCYAALLASAPFLESAPALFGIGAGALGLLLIGIRNAWDTVTYIVLDRSEEDEPPRE